MATRIGDIVAILVIIVVVLSVIIGFATAIASDVSIYEHSIITTVLALGVTTLKSKSLSKTFDSIDRLVYEPVRFLALEKLWILGKMSFTELRTSIRKEIRNLTDGNLAGHLRHLEDAGYVKAHRYFKGRRASTTYSITNEGKKAFQWFLISLLNRLHYSSEKVGIRWSPSVLGKSEKALDKMLTRTN